ncbi:MAG: Rrf2 family transcriptional regulator [Rhodobacteraceae bacterium]|nr:Rrf2 family transcriptional regulator [Paracoccaceae bacterium]
MRLTTRTNLALRTLMFCAVNDGKLVRKQDAAQAINASENHLAQVINKLGQEGFITTLRGRNGGFHLARSADTISVGAVFRTFESELPFIECFSDSNTCPLKDHCNMRPHLSRAVDAFYSALDDLYLSDLVACNAGLHALLSIEGPRVPARCASADRAAGVSTNPDAGIAPETQRRREAALRFA